MRGHQKQLITYVVSRWGEPTQTFVRREAEAVRDQGFEVDAYSIKQPHLGPDSVSVTHLTLFHLFHGVLISLLKRPKLVVAIVYTVARRSSVRNVLPQLAAALTGIGWAGAGLQTHHLHAHFGWVSATAAWSCAKTCGVSYSVTLHAFEIHTSGLWDGFAPIPLRHAEHVFCISQFDAEAVSERLGITVRVCRMGVPKEWLQEPLLLSGSGFRSKNRIVSVGSLVPKKGHALLIKAIAQTDTWTLEIIGEGPQRAELQDLIEDLGLVDRVSLAGRKPEADVRTALGKAALSTLACSVAQNGDRDGIPVALMEAMACGAPVISSNLGGIPELVSGVGVVVDLAEGEAGLVKAIASLEDPNERDRLAILAQQRVRDEWTTESAVRTLTNTLLGHCE